MRFMILVKATPDSEAGALPSPTLMAAIAKYHEDLARAGVLLEASALQPSAKGVRIRRSPAGNKTVADGPFANTRELVAGFTIIQTRTPEEAIEWAKRMPAPFEGSECEIEVRPLFEREDCGSEEFAQRFRAGEGPARG